MELHHLAALTQAHNMKHLFRCVALGMLIAAVKRAPGPPFLSRSVSKRPGAPAGAFLLVKVAKKKAPRKRGATQMTHPDPRDPLGVSQYSQQHLDALMRLHAVAEPHDRTLQDAHRNGGSLRSIVQSG